MTNVSPYLLRVSNIDKSVFGLGTWAFCFDRHEGKIDWGYAFRNIGKKGGWADSYSTYVKDYTILAHEQLMTW